MQNACCYCFRRLTNKNHDFSTEPFLSTFQLPACTFIEIKTYPTLLRYFIKTNDRCRVLFSHINYWITFHQVNKVIVKHIVSWCKTFMSIIKPHLAWKKRRLLEEAFAAAVAKEIGKVDSKVSCRGGGSGHTRSLGLSPRLSTLKKAPVVVEV